MRIIPVESINRRVNADLENFIKTSEDEYRYQLEYTVNGIIRDIETKPIILISGPSGSGKTISAHRIKQMLEERGNRTHIISMDNYFLPLNDCRNDCDDNGKVDLESPKRLDLDLLNEQLGMMLKCEEIAIPRFHFPTQTRGEGTALKRNEGDIIILEGIHALNPLVTGSVLESSSKVYVSVRTRIRCEQKHLLHPSRIRLMRRMVRDSLFRGRPLVDTIKNFNNVERGEKLYIMLYKDSADYDIDTFLHYEPCVYKKLLINETINADDADVLNEITEINYFLDKLYGIEAEHVPPHSLIREFIGGNMLMN